MSTQSSFPDGKRIAFTGRLASMSRVEVVQLILDRGGKFSNRVTRNTDLLVVGSDGWPLRPSGTVTRNLELANALKSTGHRLRILGEAEFLRQLLPVRSSEGVRRRYTIEQLSRLLGISGLRIRRWIALGLVRATAAEGPDESSSEIASATFDFQEVAAARTLSRLIASGVAPSTLAKSLKTLRKNIDDVPHLNWQLVALNKQLLLRDEKNRLMAASGQLFFAFEESDSEPQPSISTTNDPDTYFDRAFEDAREGRTAKAISGYRRWLALFGEDGEVLFNLANLYYHAGRFAKAHRFYRRCVRTLPNYAAGWNNLGLCRYHLEDFSGAVEALRRSVQLDAGNIDSLFNLADVLDEVGSEAEARLLWMRIAKTRRPEKSTVKRYARERLAEQH